MKQKTEIKKVDSQGRIVLPRDWREKVLGEENEVIKIKEGDFLKIIQKKKGDLTKFFDKLDLGVEFIEDLADWNEFEKKIREEKWRRDEK